MSPAVFKEVVIPLLGVKNTSTIAISTPDDEFNHYTKLLDLQINGELVFKVMRVGLSCARCRRLAIKCCHRRSKLPAWKDVSRQEMVEAMYGGSEADKRLMMRETHGVTIGADIYVYRLYLPAFKSMKPYAYRDKIQVVHVGLDPAAGGAGSDWGLTATCYENAKYVILGLDTINTLRFQEIEAWYIRFIKGIRNHAAYRGCLLVVSVENNTSQIEAGRVAENIRIAIGSEDVIFTSSLKNGAVGVHTGAPEKEDYAKTMLELMAHNQLRWAEDAVAISSNWKMHKEKFLDQANKFRMIEKVQADPAFGERQITWSGKAHGQADDVVLSAQITLSNHKKQRMNADFVKMCREQGRRF